jgi:transcriptional regulator GlxA family with amidase domain
MNINTFIQLINFKLMKNTLFLLFLVIFLGCNSKGNTNLDKENDEIVHIVEQNKTFQKLEKDRYNAAFLIMDGTFNREFTAPLDVFQHTIYRENIKAMNVFSVTNSDSPITIFEGMRILPNFNYLKDSLPKIDILVIPSAEHYLGTYLEDKAMIDFVKKIDKEALFVASHCDGAFILAKIGLLIKKVSYFSSDIDKMRALFPNLDVRKDVA